MKGKATRKREDSSSSSSSSSEEDMAANEVTDEQGAYERPSKLTGEARGGTGWPTAYGPP